MLLNPPRGCHHDYPYLPLEDFPIRLKGARYVPSVDVQAFGNIDDRDEVFRPPFHYPLGCLMEEKNSRHQRLSFEEGALLGNRYGFRVGLDLPCQIDKAAVFTRSHHGSP